MCIYAPCPATFRRIPSSRHQCAVGPFLISFLLISHIFLVSIHFLSQLLHVCGLAFSLISLASEYVCSISKLPLYCLLYLPFMHLHTYLWMSLAYHYIQDELMYLISVHLCIFKLQAIIFRSFTPKILRFQIKILKVPTELKVQSSRIQCQPKTTELPYD